MDIEREVFPFSSFLFQEQEQYLKAGTMFLTLHNTMRKGEGKIFIILIKAFL
jgi:hypothetical protein